MHTVTESESRTCRSPQKSRGANHGLHGVGKVKARSGGFAGVVGRPRRQAWQLQGAASSSRRKGMKILK